MNKSLDDFLGRSTKKYIFRLKTSIWLKLRLLIDSLKMKRTSRPKINRIQRP